MKENLDAVQASPGASLRYFRSKMNLMDISIALALVLEGTTGVQGMGTVGNNWFDRVLLAILYMFKPSSRPMFKPLPWDPLSSPQTSAMQQCSFGGGSKGGIATGRVELGTNTVLSQGGRGCLTLYRSVGASAQSNSEQTLDHHA